MKRRGAALYSDRPSTRQHGLSLAATLGCLQLCGCAHSNELNIFGAYFPVWLLALVLGVVAAFVARYIFVRLQIEAYLGSLTLIYVCITVSVACLVWLLSV